MEDESSQELAKVYRIVATNVYDTIFDMALV